MKERCDKMVDFSECHIFLCLSYKFSIFGCKNSISKNFDWFMRSVWLLIHYALARLFYAIWKIFFYPRLNVAVESFAFASIGKVCCTSATVKLKLYNRTGGARKSPRKQRFAFIFRPTFQHVFTRNIINNNCGAVRLRLQQ